MNNQSSTAKKYYDDSENLNNIEYGRVTKCNCCDSYNIYLGQLTLHVNEKQMHSLFYILLKALKLENNN